MFGLALGGLLGAALGVFLGFVWVSIFKTTDFEGYSGMLVFYTFMPLGALGGGLGGAVLLGIIGAKVMEGPRGSGAGPAP
jgi:hypothetical protein